MLLHGLRGWRPLNGRPELRMAVCLQVSICGHKLSLPLSVTQAPLQLWLVALNKCYAFAL